MTIVPSPPALARDSAAMPAVLHFPPGAAAVARLEPRACRWPLGEPAKLGFAFCGVLRLRRSSYCARHTRIARSGDAGQGRWA